MSTNLLAIKNLHAIVAGSNAQENNSQQDVKEILHGIDLNIGQGEVHVILGPNGSGKSTLMNVIMGHPSYEVTEGDIELEGEDIKELPVYQRSRKGIFLSFQNPEEIPGMAELQIDKSYGQRYVNVGFSGGEKKRNEILQLLMLQPKLALLDETDSGLDVDAVRLVSRGVEEYQKDREGALLIITHSTRILESLHVDYTHVMVNGHIVATGDGSMVEEINEKGYENFLNRVPGGDD